MFRRTLGKHIDKKCTRRARYAEFVVGLFCEFQQPVIVSSHFVRVRDLKNCRCYQPGRFRYMRWKTYLVVYTSVRPDLRKKGSRRDMKLAQELHIILLDRSVPALHLTRGQSVA